MSIPTVTRFCENCGFSNGYPNDRVADWAFGHHKCELQAKRERAAQRKAQRLAQEAEAAEKRRQQELAQQAEAQAAEEQLWALGIHPEQLDAIGWFWDIIERQERARAQGLLPEGF